MNFRDEKEKIIRDRDAEIEKEKENDLLSDSVFKIDREIGNTE